MNQKITNIIFCQARVPYGNLGDLILTKLLFSKLRKQGQIIVNDLDVPEWYCKELDFER